MSAPDNIEEDIVHMKNALSIARSGLGRCAPNPSVGCVIVKDGQIIARARTADGGRPHAEAQAIMAAKQGANGATLYVTLEPCTYTGQTPPCTDAIIKGNIAKVVIGSIDRNPQVSGTATRILQNAGIKVKSGILESECDEINRGFFLAQTNNRPLVTLKTACTLDGKTALKNGDSKWITGESARQHAHLVRSRHDAILIGIETARIDNPLLTTRLNGVKHNTIRIVFDTDMRLDPLSNLVKTAHETPLWVIYKVESEAKTALEQKGVILIQSDPRDIKACMAELAKRGITRLLVEGGAQIHTSFLQCGIWDDLLIYRAPCILGGDSKSMVSNLNLDNITKIRNMVLRNTRKLGEDTLETYTHTNRKE